MARADYVWVVTDATHAPIAAFTVKHELIGWLKRRTVGWTDLAESWEITRLRDGGNAVAPVRIGTAAELLAEAAP
jgi:hypothetical protein